jgi:hypothetical protein
MRGLHVLLMVFLFASIAAHAAEPAAGKWRGSIIRADGALAVEVDLWQASNGRWRGDISIPSQEAKDLPLEVDVTASRVQFRILNIPGEPPFVGKLTGNVIEGEFQNPAQPLPLKLERVKDKVTSAR